MADALDAFGEAVERRIDSGPGGRAGVREQRHRGPVRQDRPVPGLPGPQGRHRPGAVALYAGADAVLPDLRFIGPDGTEHASAYLILGLDRYELGSGEGFGSCRCIDAGNLGIVAATPSTSGELGLPARVRGRRPQLAPARLGRGVGTSFSLQSSQPVEIGLDGEALVLDPPIEFRTFLAPPSPHPVGAPGYSPAAAALTKGWAINMALLHTAAGQPVAIGAS